ncbi:MAG: GntR family transcriptional regulator, partial [bacterium]|nr:GntR family transcriptional regulator [bacterium]
MGFREIVAPSIKELFVQQLEGMILSGELRPGDKLPTERELADTMKVSKTVVHEGLRELHRLGFLDIVSRKGVTVADYAQTGSLDTLMAIMQYHGGLPDKKTAESILKLRYYLEGPAMEELASHHTADDMAELESLQHQAEEASAQNTGAFAEALLRYHRGITFLSGNTITPLIFNAFTKVNLEFWREYVEAYGVAQCLK